MASTPQHNIAHVLIGVKQPLVSEALVSFLDRHDDLRVVSSANTVSDLVDQAASLQPDVAVIDDELIASTTKDVCAEIRSFSVVTECIVYAASTHNSKVTRAAAATVFKDLNNEQLVRTIRKVFSDQRQRLVEPPEVIE